MQVIGKVGPRLTVFLAATFLWLCCWEGVVPVQAQVQRSGGMLDPNIDMPDEPFSYFWHPTDVIGALYAPAATEVTPEGYLYTGFGELMFFVGNPPEAVNQRIKTLYKGYLPIVQYHLRREGVNYKFQMFAADLGGRLTGLPVNFVRVELENESGEDRTAFLSSAYRFSPPVSGLAGLPDYRFGPRLDLIPKEYTDGQTVFNPKWEYSLDHNALVRDGRILYLFSENPEPDQRFLSLGDNGLRIYRYFTGQLYGDPRPKYTLDPRTPMGVVMYRVVLKPAQSQSLVFKMPIVPIPANSGEARRVSEADYPTHFRSTVSSWQALVSKSSPLRFPEAKVQEALLANTIYDLLAIDKVVDDYVPNVNKFQYHNFYGGGDTDHMMVALDYLGLNAIAGKAALHSVKSQLPDGAFFASDDNAETHHWETFGNTLWNWGRHYSLTRDSQFLHQVYPSLLRAMAWEERLARQDPLGLMPRCTNPDDAWLSDVHQTGQDIWTLIGIRNAIRMAKAAGQDDDAARFEVEYQRFWKAFEKQLSIQTSQTGGYITPALDRSLGGNNWDNLLTLYPEPLFSPFDPRVTATIRQSRATYSEGILGYINPHALRKQGEGYVFDSTRLLHYWHSLDNAENGLVRGEPEEQEEAVRDLYAMLLHTSSTHATEECCDEPWSMREVEGNNLMPDGASSGVLIELMRNMVVREYKNDLFLLSAVSPAWLEPGRNIEALNEPTEFGPITFVLQSKAEGWEIKISNTFWKAPEKVIIRVPWFYEVQQIEADGHSIEPTYGQLVISATTQEVGVRGRIKPGTPPMSFAQAVRDYEREYRKRYADFVRTGDTR